MAWIKQNYDRFLLALAAVTLLACAGVLAFFARGFNDVFAELKGHAVHQSQIPPVDFNRLTAAREKLKAPAKWLPVKAPDIDRSVPLFVSIPYIENPVTDPAGNTTVVLVDPLTDPRPLHPPIPNKWFIDYKLMDDLLAVDALTRDPDGDGFTNLDEYLGKTDPTDKNSHPPYTTKLFLKKFIQKPFRLKFSARNGNTILLDTLDVDSPTQFLHVGDQVRETKFKVVDLQIKEGVDAMGIHRDLSVLTLQNQQTGDKIQLPKDQEVDSPDSFALLTYIWTQPATDIKLKKNDVFSLKPEDDIKYRLVSVSQENAVIERASDKQTLTIPQLPK